MPNQYNVFSFSFVFSSSWLNQSAQYANQLVNSQPHQSMLVHDKRLFHLLPVTVILILNATWLLMC